MVSLNPYARFNMQIAAALLMSFIAFICLYILSLWIFKRSHYKTTIGVIPIRFNLNMLMDIPNLMFDLCLSDYNYTSKSDN